MVRSLVLLTRLRAGGVFRRWRRSLARPKGILVTVVLGLLVLIWVGFLVAMPFLAPTPTSTPLPGWLERYGPAGLCAITLVTLFTSTGEQTLYFSPAEIDFLFAGPYNRRQLLGYKLILALLSASFSAVIFGLLGLSRATVIGSSFLGAWLTLMFFTLSQLVFGLAISTLGSLAWSRTRRLVLVTLGIVLAVTILPNRATLRATDWAGLAQTVEQSPITAVVLTPFGWFFRTYLARDLASLISAATPALLTNLVLVGLVFALEAGSLEAAAAASAQRLAKIQQAVGGGGTIKLGGRRVGWFKGRFPNPPWWGGVGPNLWRQMLSALGNPTRLLILFGLFGGAPSLFAATLQGNPRSQEILLAVTPSILASATLFLSMLLAYDFRGDLDVMETLKTLPIRPNRLALGQVLTPAILASLLQISAAVGLLVGAGGLPGLGGTIALGLMILFPANLYFFVVENLLFLWFPSRMVAGQFDGMAIVRQLLLLALKGVAMGLALTLAAGVGVGVYFLFGRQMIAGLGAVWVTLAGLALALVPLLGQSFRNFDLNHDVPA